MLIRRFDDYQDSYDSDDLRDLGIIKHKRTIIIFVNKNEYEHKLCRSARFALINECVFDGSAKTNLSLMKIDNSTINRTAIYFGTVNYEVPNDIRTAYFRVDIGINKERQTLHNTAEVYTRGISSISTLASQYSEEVVSELLMGFETTVLPPKFYTEMQMYRMSGDFGNFIVDDHENEYPYSDIIDRSTTFEYMDINMWDTMKREIVVHTANEMDARTQQNQDYNNMNVADSIISSFEYALLEDATFIYDSDAKGMNVSGVNVLGGKITNGKFIPKQFAVSNLEKALLLFNQSCHNIENNYGHIRVMCRPSNIGSKIKIHFKDYNVSPIQGLNNSDNVNCASSNIDAGFTKNAEIGEALESMAGNMY